MRGILTFVLCYLPLTTFAALVLAPNTSTPRLPTDLLNISNPPHTFNSSNSTAPGNPLMHRFKVPGTDTVLRLTFGLRRRLDPTHMRSLIAVAEDYVDEEMENLPPALPGLVVLYPVEEHFYQIFHKTLGDGIGLLVENNYNEGKFFAWDELRNVLLGLRLYLIEGGRPWQTEFKFYEGVEAPGMTTPYLGFGKVFWEGHGSDDEMDAELATEERR